jgi:hypothetical protein
MGNLDRYGCAIFFSETFFVIKFSRRYSTASQSNRSTQFSSLGGTTGRQPHHSIYPPPPPNKECHQLLLHCDVGLRNGGTAYIGGGISDTCRSGLESSSLPWPLVDRGVAPGYGGRQMSYGDGQLPEYCPTSEHVYESPTFERRTMTCASNHLTGIVGADTVRYGTGLTSNDCKKTGDMTSDGGV